MYEQFSNRFSVSTIGIIYQSVRSTQMHHGNEDDDGNQRHHYTNTVTATDTRLH